MRVLTFTTYYPRHDRDHAGRFVADLVAQVEAADVDVAVLAPGDYNDHGLAYGRGIVANARRHPVKALRMLWSMIRTTRRAAKDVDVVHVHWLAAAIVGRLCGRPWVVTLHGTGTAGRFQDLELMRRHPRIIHWLLRPASTVICVSPQLEAAARACGLAQAQFIPNGVAIPTAVPPPAEPPHLLWVGRLSPEKGVDILAEAADGLPRVIIGEGELASLVPDAQPFRPPADLADDYDRAAVLLLTSRSEGLPVVITEAMAHGRPVVATDVGGVGSVVEDGVTGVLCPSGDATALREAVAGLLKQPDTCREMGAAGRERVRAEFSWDAVAERIVATYRAACAGRATPQADARP